jgi:NAD(P)-dependent dehydrogenase (short-subunit alcohol dehydrogenase family)
MKYSFMKLVGKIAVVTGAASGIGRAIAEKFSLEGAIVYGLDSDEATLQRTSDDFSVKGISIRKKICDVSVENQVVSTMNEIFKEQKSVDVLVNNAGIMDDFIPLPYVSNSLWEKVLGVNLYGPFFLIREVLPTMLKNNFGVIVNIDSVAGLSGGKAGLTYTVSKHALIGLTQHLAFCYAQNGIRCNALAPGAVNTEIGKKMKPDVFGYERFQKGSATIPRAASPEEIATAALFLASDDASFVNGAVLVVDAGWTAY